MPTRAYIIPRRNDLNGVNIQITDLRPNTSQRNLIYEGPGQSGYLKWSYDQPGVTVVQGESFVSGSMTTAPVSALVLDDTTGGGNDVQVPGVAQFGLAAYLRERIEAGGLAAGTAPPSPAQALAMANGIAALVEAASDLDVTAINAVLAGVVAATELDGAGGSASFGTVEEVLQMLQGGAYRVRSSTIITDNAGVFQTLAQRNVLVANQDVVANGGTTFYATGGFLAAGEPGARPLRELAVSGSLRISLNDGVMSGLVDATFGFLNPNFDYAAGGVQTRATDIGGTAIPTTGVHPALAVYTSAGTLLP